MKDDYYQQLSENWGSFEKNGIRCSNLFKAEQKSDSVPDPSLRPDPETTNVIRVFRHGKSISGGGECLGRRLEDKFEFLTFDQVGDKVDRLAQAMAIKAQVKKNDCIGLYSANCPEWAITAVACASASLVVVPLYATFGPQAIEDIINEVSVKIIFADTPQALQSVLSLGNGRLPDTLKKIVVFQSFSPQSEAEKIKGVEVVTLEEFMQLPPGSTERIVLEEPSSDDLYMIQYSSGTTGRPKGIMLTHGNMAANIVAVLDMYRLPNGQSVFETPTIRCISYLPLAHSYGQILMLCVLYVGGSTGFFGGNIQKLMDDAQLLQPTFFPLVPRLMNRFYSTVCAEVKRSGKLRSGIFWLAYSIKRRWLLDQNCTTKTSIWDNLVFKKLHAKLGGKVEFMISASAPVSPEVLEFWRVCFGGILVECYGQTEATALVTASYGPEGGNIGHPASCNTIKLVDVEEMGYFSREGRGELCIKGTNIMRSYFNAPDKTAEAIHADGWLHTGDIGEIMKDTGALRLIDRKKHIFKLAQGEYVAPEKIESIYSTCPLVAQVFVDGDSLQWFTVAVVVPDPVEAKLWASRNGVTGDQAELYALCGNPKFRQHILDELLSIGRERKLNQLEQVRAIHLHADPFSVANDMLTPSMKNRRPQLRAHFKTEIAALYANAEQK